MKIAVINPNSTASMTEKIRAAAAGAAFADTEVMASNPPAAAAGAAFADTEVMASNRARFSGEY